MTKVVYDHKGPSMVCSGHAGAGKFGSDLVCAALSILMYTLEQSVIGAQVQKKEGYWMVKGGDPSAYEYTAVGVCLLEEAFPRYVELEERL